MELATVYYITRRGTTGHNPQLCSTILSLFICYLVYNATSSLEYPTVMTLTSVFYTLVESRSFRKGQPLTSEATIFGLPVSFGFGAFLRGFGEMGAFSLLAFIASDYYLNPMKFIDANNTLLFVVVMGVYLCAMMIVFPSFTNNKNTKTSLRLISNRSMTDIRILYFVLVMASIDCCGYILLSNTGRERLKYFFIFESLLVFQWNLCGYFISKKRYIAIDAKGTVCPHRGIQILLLLNDSIVEMAVVLSPFVVATLKTQKL